MSQSFNTATLGSSGGYRHYQRYEEGEISTKQVIIAGAIIVLAVWGLFSTGKGPETNTPTVDKDSNSGYGQKSGDNNAESTSHSMGSGSDPPKPPQNFGKEENNEPSLPFQEFYNLLQSIIEELKKTHQQHAKELDRILDIFKGLPKEDKKTLMKIMKRMHKNRCLKQVITIVAKLLSESFPEHINYLDFIRFSEFVGAYILEEAQRRNVADDDRDAFNARLDEILNDIGNNTRTAEDIANVYLRVRQDIDRDVGDNGHLSPDFRNIPAATYHYFKHRRVPGGINVLNVTEYYSLIRRYLNEFKQLKEYESNVISGGQIVYEVYLARYGSRFKLVVKVHGSDVVLSSAYFVDDPDEDDEDGDVFINGKKRL